MGISGSFMSGLPCCYSACMVTEGLFDGVSRDEKLAMRRAERAARRFRTERGYEQPSPLVRLFHGIFQAH